MDLIYLRNYKTEPTTNKRNTDNFLNIVHNGTLFGTVNINLVIYFFFIFVKCT